MKVQCLRKLLLQTFSPEKKESQKKPWFFSIALSPLCKMSLQEILLQEITRNLFKTIGK